LCVCLFVCLFVFRRDTAAPFACSCADRHGPAADRRPHACMGTRSTHTGCMGTRSTHTRPLPSGAPTWEGRGTGPSARADRRPRAVAVPGLAVLRTAAAISARNVKSCARTPPHRNPPHRHRGLRWCAAVAAGRRDSDT
jgi:hypothetical protein